ncbi:glycoside hydrolase family 15 protein [Humibacter antri]
MDGYSPIEEHGLIGDLQTAALVSHKGEIDWFCCPRFDSPTVFASLLDRERGGHFRIRPAGGGFVTRQLYMPDTAILITRFMSDDGVGEIIDFMPLADDPQRATSRHDLVRLVHVVRGSMRFEIECAPRFDYGRAAHDLHVDDAGAVFETPGLRLSLSTGIPLQAHGGSARGVCDLSAGQLRALILRSGADTTPERIDPRAAFDTLERTGRFWRTWVNASSYRGRWREHVMRSAMTLKMMTYAPTGGLVAAPTAGLPEQIGGERNWDYRYSWVRDSSFSVQALLGLGYTDEAQAFTRWISDRVKEHEGDASGPLKIMYRVDGSSDLVEEELTHFAGYRDSRPVRIGNGAADQLQLDVYGEVVGCLALADRAGACIDNSDWDGIAGMVDWLSTNWDRPDEGIWESRGGARDHTYSRLMSWVAFDRAIRMSNDRGWPGAVADWTQQRDAVYRQIMARGWNADRKAFVQHYGSDVLDASLLVMPTSGFLSPHDPRWRSTLGAIRDELVSDSLLYRYNPSAAPDGLAGDEGTFSLCSFWYVEALAQSGMVEQARWTLEKMFSYANHLGLYGEELGRRGEHLGNFPQAFSHLALINAAVSLDARLGDRPMVRLNEQERARLLAPSTPTAG